MPYIQFSLYKQSQKKCCYLIAIIIALMALIPSFPVLLLVVKFISIFHNGVEWKKLDDLMTLCEGQLESYLQLGLQTYIICVRADRQRDKMRRVYRVTETYIGWLKNEIMNDYLNTKTADFSISSNVFNEIISKVTTLIK